MPGEPLVSVITITKNAADTVSKTLDSVLSQDWKHLEYIIIDGGSTDGTLDIISRRKSLLSYFLTEPDHGIYDAMNKALRAANGALILFMNADDNFIDENSLTKLVNARLMLPRNPTRIVYSDFIRYYPSLDRRVTVSAHSDFAKGFAICHQTMLVDRSAYDSVGSFDPGLRFAGDFDWAARADRAGIKFHKATCGPTVQFRHGGATHRHFKVGRSESTKIVQKYYGFAPFVKYAIRQRCIRTLRQVSDILEKLIGQRYLGYVQLLYFRVVRGQQVD